MNGPKKFASLLASSGWLGHFIRLVFAIAFIVFIIIISYAVCRYICESYLNNEPNLAKEDDHIIVTGGSSGIGLEMTRIYLNRGFKVTIAARNKKKLDEALEDLVGSCIKSKDFINFAKRQKIENTPEALKKFATARIFLLSVDCSASESEVNAAFATAIEKFGPPYTLVNCAGTSIAGEFDKLPIEEFERMLRINVMGSILPTRACLSAMKKNRKGKIIFVSSQVGQIAIHGYTAYGASKWAVRGMAEALQQEVKPFNISVSIAYPPDTDTPGYKEEMLSKPKLTAQISESGCVFTPEEVAESIIKYAHLGYYNISIGVDGFLLKQVHPGMSPINNPIEFIEQVFFSSLCRFIAFFYILSWDILIAKHVSNEEKNLNKKENQ